MRPAWADEVVHRAVLRIDEQGLEGAAATAVVVAMRAMVTPPTEPLLVEVDRPFLLLIRHQHTGASYFLARVTDPSCSRGARYPRTACTTHLQTVYFAPLRDDRLEGSSDDLQSSDIRLVR